MEILNIAIDHEGKITFVFGNQSESAEEWYDITLDDKWLNILKEIIELRKKTIIEKKQ